MKLDEQEKSLYRLSIDYLYKELNSSLDGLCEAEASKRLLQNGPNKLTDSKKQSNIIKFMSHLKDLMTLLLIFASIFSAFVSYIRNEPFTETFIILGIIIINTILSFVQEKKAEVAIEELNKMFITNAHVIRNGKKISIDVREIVVGDIVELEAGDYVAADARVIEANNLEIDESTLTGESKYIGKNSDLIHGDVDLHDQKNMVFAGCNVKNGRALVLVCATGMNTELGKIAASLSDKKQNLTPLQKKVNETSKIITYALLSLIIVMLIFGVFAGNDPLDILMLSIALAVAAIPESLASIITIILSLGMAGMAKKNVIVRKMASVETLGATNVICSDKTGTITENKMTVMKIYFNGHVYNESEHIPNAKILFKCASLCNNVVKNKDNHIGSETEVAVFKYLEKQSYVFKEQFNKIDEMPFDSKRKMMSVVYEDKDQKYSFTKGALEQVLSNCSYYLKNEKVYPMTKAYKANLLKIEEQKSSESLRILAFAYKDKELNNVESDMVFIGLIGMMDPPRDSALEAILTCKRAGIRPIMITGDSINTAVAIAKKVSIIETSKKAITGKVVDKMSDAELKEAVNYYGVFARVTPHTKLRIVEALQNQGLVVAMTGDGINDAPAIKRADVGIGMGIAGTEVVKKVSDCVLIDDSFSSIVDGVEEGRRITSNIKKIILYIFGGNIIEVLLVFVAMLLGFEIFTVLQLLWINLITDAIPAIMLAFEKSDRDTMDDSLANRFSSSFFTPFLTARLLIGSLLKSIVIFALFLYFVQTTNLIIASSLIFIFIIIHELLFAYSCRNPKKSVINKNFFANRNLNLGMLAIIIAHILVFSTDLSNYFIVGNLGFHNILIVIVFALVLFIIGELVKPLYVKYFKDYREEDANEN